MLKFNILVLIMGLFYSAICLGSVPQLTAQQLIAKYLENSRYNQLQVTKSQTLAEFQSLNDSEPQLNLYKTEFRRDDERWDILETKLRKLKSIKNLKAESSESMRRFWDGKLLYDHWFYEESPENVLKEQPIVIVKNPKPINRTFAVGYCGAPFNGILTGDLEPLSVIFDRASEIKVRKNKEFVGNSECYVIDAEGQDGKYTIWIDPEHGYNIMQAEVEKTGNDFAFGRRLEPNNEFKFSIKNVKLKLIQGHWVPMEGDFLSETTRGKVVSRGKRHYKRISVDLNPDFSKIGAFTPDIPNGTNILIKETSGIRYKWQDGKPIPQVDQSFLDILNFEIKCLKNNSTDLNSVNYQKDTCDLSSNKSELKIIENKNPELKKEKLSKKNLRSNLFFLIPVFLGLSFIVAISLYKIRKGQNG